MWRILAAGLLAVAAAQPAEARMHAPYRGHRIIPANAAPLDGFAQPSGAYSFRKLKSTYAGPAMRIRRASDNAETDINFLGCTGFTGCPWDEAAATAHCAATTCFVVTKYDQSGNARDIPQGTAANQPQLILGCQGGVACMETTSATQALLAAGNVTPATGVASFSAVGNRVTGTGVCTWVRENGNTGQRINTSPAAATWRVLGGTSGSVIATAVTDNAWHAAQAVVNDAASVINVDGVETTGTAAGSVTAGTPGLVGAASTTCRHAEEIYWDAYTSTPAERAALGANQRSFWGTP